MGGGEWLDQQQVQKPLPLETAHISIEHDEDIAHQSVHWLGDTVGYSTVLILVGIGALFAFKKKIAGAVRGFLGVKKDG